MRSSRSGQGHAPRTTPFVVHAVHEKQVPPSTDEKEGPTDAAPPSTDAAPPFMDILILIINADI